jgi:signal transduction histidine kinase
MPSLESLRRTPWVGPIRAHAGDRTLSRRSGAAARDAVFVFDASGARCAATTSADDVVGGGRIAYLDDLAARYRRPDGLPLDLDTPGTRIGVDVDGKSGARVTITTEAVADGDSPSSAPALVVMIRSFGGDDDPSTVQRALGSVLAHELRTPLTTIVGGSQLLRGATTSPATKQEAANSIAREAQRLSRIVDDLVVLVRGPRDSSADLEPVMLQHVLRAIVDAQREMTPEARIELAVAGQLPPVLASEANLAHAMRNVLEHAVRQTPSGTAVQVEAARANGSVEVRIHDAGPARDETQAARAFDLFATSKADKDPSGANVALVVARELVIAMGGTMSASGDDQGGVLSLRIPVAHA